MLTLVVNQFTKNRLTKRNTFLRQFEVNLPAQNLNFIFPQNKFYVYPNQNNYVFTFILTFAIDFTFRSNVPGETTGKK